MIDKEKYGVEVTAETSLFKRKMQELANFIKGFGKEAEKQTRFIIDPSVNIKDLYKWREELQSMIKESKKDIANFGNTPTGKYYKEDLQRYEEGLIAVNNRIEEIEKSEEKVNDELEKTNETQVKQKVC